MVDGSIGCAHRTVESWMELGHWGKCEKVHTSAGLQAKAGSGIWVPVLRARDRPVANVVGGLKSAVDTIQLRHLFQAGGGDPFRRQFVGSVVIQEGVRITPVGVVVDGIVRVDGCYTVGTGVKPRIECQQ